MGPIRRMLFSNWRNKGVALFFAVSIWFVAYRSETREYTTPVAVRFVPADGSSWVITELAVGAGRGEPPLPFTGRARLTFVGPRKQVDKIRERPPGEKTLEVPAEAKTYTLSQEDFDYPRDGVFITAIAPPAVSITQERVEEVVEEVQIQIDPPFGSPYWEFIKEITRPEARSVRLRVPSSRKEVVDVRVKVALQKISLQEGPETYGAFKLDVYPEDDELLQRTVRLWRSEKQTWVSAADAPLVPIKVRREAKEDSFAVDAVRITFRVPLIHRPYQLITHDIPGDTIQVEFHGPRDQIQLLRQRLRDEPGFALSVPLPGSLDVQKGGTFTFTEDDLELYGFPGVRIRRHPSRAEQLKTAWSYEVKVLAPEGEKKE